MRIGNNRAFLVAAAAACVLALAGTAAAEGPAAPVYTFAVREDRLLGDRDGTLTLSVDKVEYRSEDGEHGGAWAYRDIQRFEVLSKTRVRITTYEDTKLLGRDRSITLDLTGDELAAEVSDFLRARLPRPFVTWFTDRERPALAELAVKHNHRFGGCQGTLAIYDDRLVFASDDGHGSRTWVWTDLRGVSRPGPYRLELSTYERELGSSRAFTFELKEGLADAVYDAIWQRVYRPAPLRRVPEPPAGHKHHH
ncbi:MAG: hypothetical protein M3Y34_02975 [Actinomycetota bacterium]|jgi:hypothetical protein|nr:hypothetical protein [Actinomycetota bacterium]